MCIAAVAGVAAAAVVLAEAGGTGGRARECDGGSCDGDALGLQAGECIEEGGFPTCDAVGFTTLTITVAAAAAGG